MTKSKRPKFVNTGEKAKKGTFKRLIKMLLSQYKGRLFAVIICLLFSTVATTSASIFLNVIINHIESAVSTGWNTEISRKILSVLAVMAAVFLAGVLASYFQARNLAFITQGFLNDTRKNMFGKMQNLPVRYFDSHSHGDIMSYYTNDIDTLRQLVSQSVPSLIVAVLTVVILVSYMLYLSIWMTLIVFGFMAILLIVVRKIGGNASKFFLRQQKSLGKTEGYIEEMMSGQKVVKVFCHEEESCREFDKINNQLFHDSSKAHSFANMLMPIVGNIGHALYVTIALAGGIMMLTPGIKNISLSGQALTLAVVIPFISMTKQFTNNITNISQHFNNVIMALAGAERIFELMDEIPESDEGYVTLVNAEEKNGTIRECSENTGVWAWKHPHSDGSITFTKLEGDIVIEDVDFGYEPQKIILHDISLRAKPGQKVAFVGATGAGKTTITNLLNRFYDAGEGKIRYDGININKIKKADLRRSLGIVLQETSLFTGTVMDNIRYGRLDASDEECIAAAKLANADDFISRLSDGYNTVLTANGANLSQGQRQLLAIARAEVADAPVMILDEATSSIDTRTEQLVQQGMDALMKGRTVFVIAHRLSTICNSDVIMVLDNGRIIERGSHEQLLEKHGKYYRLYTGNFEE